MRGWLSGFSPFIAAAGLLVLGLTPVAAVQASRYGVWAEPAAIQGALGLVLLALSRRLPGIPRGSIASVSEPVITWAGLQDWAKQNEVPGDAVLNDEDGNPLVDLSYERPEEADPDDPEDEGSGPVLVLQKTYG